MAGDEVRIGYSLSRTGRFADPAGLWYGRAYGLWAAQANARGGLLGRPVRAVVYDDASEPDRAAENYRRLIEEDGVALLFGPCHTRLMGPVTRVAEEHEVLLLQATHGSYDDFQEGLRHQLLCWPGCDFDYARPFLAHLAATDPEARRRGVALAHTDGRIGASVARGARRHAAALGIPVVLDEPIAAAPFDYPALMRRVAEADPAALLIGLDHGRADDPRPSCLEAAHAVGLAAERIWHSDSPTRADLALGPANEGVHMRVTWAPELHDPRARAFAEDFRAAYGAEPEFHCAGGFACGEVLAGAAQAAGTFDPAPLRRAIGAARFETVVGALRFQASGLPECALHVGRWRRGALEILDP